MARQFTMGARINLNTGSYSSGMSDAIRATNNMREEVVDLDRAMGRYHDSSGRLREANGRFASSAGTATRALEAQQSQMGRLSGVAQGLIGVFAALGGAMAIKGAYNWLIESNASMEQYQNTLTVVLGSQKKAVDTLAWAQKFAAKTPFEIPQIVEATTRMASYGIEAKDTLGIVGDMASVMGKDLMQAVEAVADAQTGELERLKEFGITKKMIEDQAKAMGKSPINNKGQITDAKAFNAALFKLMDKRFKGGMEMQAKSFKGMLSNASDFIGTFGRQLGAPLFDKMKAGLGDLLGYFGRLQENGTLDAWVKNIQSGAGKIGAVFGAIAAPVKALYDMMAGSGDQSYFIKLFGSAEAANNFNNLMWDIIDTSKAIGSAIGTGFSLAGAAIGKIGGVLAKAGSIFMQYYPQMRPYIIGIATAFLAYFTYLKLVNTWTKIVTIAQAAWNAVMAMNPVLLVVLGIGLLIGYLIHLAGGWEVVKAKLLTFLPVLQMLWSKIVTAVMPILRQLWTLALTIFNNFKAVLLPIIMNFINQVVAGFFVFVGWIKAHWTEISFIIQVAWAIISSYISSGIEIAKAIIMGGFQLIAAVVSNVWQMISGVIQVAWSLISGLISVGLKLLQGDWKGAWDSMLNMLSGVWSGITDFFGGLKDLFLESGKAIMNTLADGIKAAAMAPVKAVKSALAKARDLLPFSDAKTGPLSSLTLNGSKIVTTMAEGIYKQKNAVASAMNSVLGTTPGLEVKAGTVNPAGTAGKAAGGGAASVIIEKLVESITITGADSKNASQLVDEIIAQLYEKLSNAEEILSAAGLGALLND
jgi:uncharacterized protein YukE